MLKDIRKAVEADDDKSPMFCRLTISPTFFKCLPDGTLVQYFPEEKLIGDMALIDVFGFGYEECAKLAIEKVKKLNE